MDFAGGPAAALAMTAGGAQTQYPGGPAVLGPDLWEDMGETAFVEALNAWGSSMHREVRALRTDLSSTQTEVSGAFGQAQEAVRELVAASCAWPNPPETSVAAELRSVRSCLLNTT